MTTDPNHPIEVVAERIAGIVVLADTAVEDVTDDLLATLDCTERTVKIDSNDIVVLRMNEDQEEYAMLSNIRKYPDATIRLTCWREGTEIPEPSTLLCMLLGVGIGFLISMMTRKQHNRSRKGGRSMKHLKTLLFALVLLPLLVGTATSAELKVLIIGTGDGFVEGEEISCPSFCEETYEQGSVVHLKADPYDDSTFEGWMVNGKPHEGVITIDQDIILVTARFELKTPPDELQVMWYDGNYKEWMTMALDEIVIFPAKRREKVFVLEGEFKTAMEEVARLFHPQAKVIGLSQLEITLKSPEPVAKERLPEILAAMKQHEYVWQAGPVLYLNPNDPDSEVIPTGEILVQFPASYTEDQILAIEQEYGLVRFKSYPDDPYYFVYQTEDPLKAIEIANRLYESGLVELSTPDALMPGALLNQLLEVDSLADHWHFRDPSQHGADVIGAWALNDNKNPPNPIRGSGVVIAILDDGVEVEHPDLKPNPARNLCFDFLDAYAKGYNPEDQDDPSPTTTLAELFTTNIPKESLIFLNGAHGTNVSGIAAARHNGIGIYGIAPKSGIAGYRLLDAKVKEGRIVPIKWKKDPEIEALKLNKDKIHIYNNSRRWGKACHRENFPKKLRDELKNTALEGRIFVSGAANDRKCKGNSNYNPWANSRYTIAVAASTEDGTFAPYSNSGASVLVNAPCHGIPTTDRTGGEGDNPYFDDYGDDYQDFDYTNRFAGTSAAAPVTSGIIALMLQANSKLDWRDVQQILIETADKNPGEVWKPNTAGYAHSYDYGFGRVNAKKAVEAALSWTEHTVPKERAEPVTGKNTDKETISPNEEIPKEIEIPENIRVEFVEVELNVEYHHWCLLEVELTSPDGTTSILSKESTCISEEMSSFEKYGFGNWRFGSVRHFGESSTGKWTLTIRHKGWYDDAEFKKWNIALYGTELPPYVKEVEARSGDELIYSAEWVVEEDGQLEFVEYVEPKNISNHTPLHIKIMTSEAMQWLSLNLFDKDFSSKEGTTKIQQADDTGTVWEVTIDPADFPQDDDGDLPDVYTLTITGQDSGDLYLLPFADRSPKILPTHPSDPDWPAYPNAGDTVHLIGNILSAPFTWSIITPTESTCKQNRGGIVCAFDDGNTETVGRGSVALLPEGVPTPPEEVPQYVGPVPTDEAGLTHHGIYQLPEEGLNVVVQPQANWFPPCTPDDPQEARCPWSEDYEHKPAPPDSEETKTLTWKVETETDEDRDTCQVRVTWDSETVVVVLLTEQSLERLRDAGVPHEIVEGLQDVKDLRFPTKETLWKAVEKRITHEDLAQYHDLIVTHVEQQKAVTTIELHPSTLCERMTGDRSGILDATATCTWKVQRMLDYQWKEMGPFDKVTGYGKNMKHYHKCQSSSWLIGGGVLMKYDCQEDPHWQQDPEPQTFELIQPGKQGFLPIQLQHVTYSGCQWEDWEFWDWWMKIGTRWYWYTEIACLESGDCHRQRMGQSTCQAQETYFQWKGVSNCEYAKTLGHVAYPDGAIEVLLLPEP